MRPLTADAPTRGTGAELLPDTPGSAWYENNGDRLKRKFHSRCIFNEGKPVERLRFFFSDDGDLHGHFICDERHEGYDEKVHGGILAAIIDASMTQCLMGHGIAGYTATLSVRYRSPVLISVPATIKTRLTGSRFDKMYSLETTVNQNHKICVTAISQFIRITQ